MTDSVKKIYLINIKDEINFEYEIEYLDNKSDKSYLAYFNLNDDELLAVHKQITNTNLIVLKLANNQLDLNKLNELYEFDLSVRKFYELEKIIRFMNTQIYSKEEQNRIINIANESYKLGLDASEYDSAIRALKGLVENGRDN